MPMNIENARVPVSFEILDESLDDRLMKVKIYVAHTGENRNNSYFTKEALDRFAKTIPRIPIVGYIECDEDDNEDFTNHRNKIVITSGKGVDVVYEGHAYGYIPDECNASYEIREGKEWLTVEGVMWTKFKDAMEIMVNSNGVKSQSMEIQVTDGYVDQQGRMVYTNGFFSALCILGEDVEPAMKGSTIEFFSEPSQYEKEVVKIMAEFTKEKGESALPVDENKETSEDVTKEVSMTENSESNEDNASTDVVEDTKVDEGVDESSDTAVDEPAVEDPITDVDESTKEDPTPEVVVEGGEDFSEVEEGKLEGSKSFELSHEDIREKLRAAIYNTVDHEDSYVYLMKVYETYAIFSYETYGDEGYIEKTMKVNYSITDNEISVGASEEVFSLFLSEDEKKQIETQREEIKELKEQLGIYQVAEKEEKVAEFAEILGEEKSNEIRANFDKLSTTEVEKEVGFACFQLEKEKKPSVAKAVNFSRENEAASKYGSEVSQYFQK